MGILDAQVPSQRWALPMDDPRDKYENEYEAWLNEHYDMKDQMIMGRRMTWEQACEDEWLFDDFMEMRNDRG